MKVALQVFAYREPHLARTLDAWAAQPTPPTVSVDHEAWVTPAGPLENDETWLRADAHDAFRARVADAGKLTARNQAHEHAATSDYDAIVAIDADAPPLDERTLAKLLVPLSRGEAVATNSRPEAPWTVLGTATNLLGWAHDHVQPHINGQAHAFTTEAWNFAGPFETDRVDETRSGTHVRREEEFAFRRRLETYGRVLDREDARVYNDPRRTKCRLREPFAPLGADAPDYCERRAGETTFDPAATRRPQR